MTAERHTRMEGAEINKSLLALKVQVIKLFFTSFYICINGNN